MFNVIITEPQLVTNHPPSRCAVHYIFGGDDISAWTCSHVQPVSGSLLDKHFQTVHVYPENDPEHVDAPQHVCSGWRGLEVFNGYITFTLGKSFSERKNAEKEGEK